jgi:predicted nucleic acid-binding protein
MKKTQLFIDANIYLEYFRENSSERLTPLKELVKLVEKDKITLLIPEQTKQEYYRNRRKIAENTRSVLVKQSKSHFVIPAILDKDVSEIKHLNKEIDNLHESYKKLIEKYDDNVKKEKTDADLLIRKLFEMGASLNEEKTIIEKAHFRYMKGNPPRKSDYSYGDAIIWETLLDKAIKDNLILITKDSDYMEVYKDEYVINHFLYVEWKIKSKNKSKVELFKSLAEFINHFDNKNTIKKEIVEKEKLKSISHLNNNIYLDAGDNVWGNPILASSLSRPISVNPDIMWNDSSSVSTLNTAISFSDVSEYNNNIFSASLVLPGSTINHCPYCGSTVQQLIGKYWCSSCQREFMIK